MAGMNAESSALASEPHKAKVIEERAWYARPKSEVLQLLQTDPLKGLSPEEAAKRLAQYGPNELAAEKKTSPWKMLLEQFTSILIVILLAATVVSAVLGETLDALVIFIIVIACAVLGFVQEYRASKAMEALKKMAALTAPVVRGGEECQVPAAEVVPGDIVILNTGEKVPADCLLLEAVNLKAEEAALTGESMPVSKEAGIVLAPETALGDRRNMVFAATVINYGRGRGVVVATGMQTEFGRIAGLMQEVEAPPTPLEQRLDVVGKWLGILCLAVVGLVTGVEVLLRGEPLLAMFIWGVSLAVAAVPEALPAVVTGALSIGMQRMARNNAIVRRLPAVETLGCTGVICSDKTGTLTKNEMTVREVYVDGEVYEVTGVGYEPKGEFRQQGVAVAPKPSLMRLAEIMALCNDAALVRREQAWSLMGDPTEGALVVVAEKAGLAVEDLRRERPRLGEIPFDSERKCMTTVHSEGEGQVAYVKGAPEVLLAKATHLLEKGKVLPLTPEKRREILALNEAMARRALRVLAGAFRELPPGFRSYTPEELERDLVFVGLMGMIDPPREEVRAAIRTCQEAGVRAVMVTGDHKLTALAIAAELGQLPVALKDLTPDQEQRYALTGPELDGLDEREFARRVEEVVVYARVSPEHKMRIVDAWQEKAQVVAMTGDGVNDAPALKKADIGVAMGITGTDVTKEAADMVLADDNFATIVRAVEEGRCIFDNIKKYLLFLLSCNIAEILVCFFSALLNWPIPLAPIHLLWINLVTDGLPALALGVDPPDPDIMRRPPRDPKEGVFTRRIVGLIGGIGTWITIFLLGIFFWYWRLGGPAGLTVCAHQATSIGLGLDAFLVMKAQTMTMATMIVFELLNAYNCRHDRYSLFQIGWFGNRWLNLAVVSSFGLALLVLYVPGLARAFHVVPLGVLDWVVAGIAGVTVILFVELVKATSGMFPRRQTVPSLSGHPRGVSSRPT